MAIVRSWTQILTGEQFAQWAKQALRLSEVNDVRPFQTLLDTYAKDGKSIKGHPFGDITILFNDGRKAPYTHQTFLQVVQMAKDINRRFQRTANGSFQAMCLEEDAEELELLAELAKKHRNKAAPTPKPEDFLAADEEMYALATEPRPVFPQERNAGLTKRQQDMLATMSSTVGFPMDEAAYSSEFDLAAMF